MGVTKETFGSRAPSPAGPGAGIGWANFPLTIPQSGETSWPLLLFPLAKYNFSRTAGTFFADEHLTADTTYLIRNNKLPIALINDQPTT